MTEVNRYGSGELSSTDLMREAMEESHSVERGDGKKLDWKADHETWAAGRERVHDEPAKVMKTAAEKALAIAGPYAAVKGAVKAAPELLAKSPKATIRERLAEVGKWAAGVAAADGGPLMAGAAGMAAAIAVPWRACSQGEDLRHLSDLDAMDVAATAVLDLDPSFKAHDIGKHPGIVPEKVVTFLKTTSFAQEHLPDLQAAADVGSRAAIDALRVGRESYLALHPDVAQRMQTDIAFDKGFESVLWAAALEDGEARLREIKTNLDARDPRANVAQQIRG